VPEHAAVAIDNTGHLVCYGGGELLERLSDYDDTWVCTTCDWKEEED